MGCFHLYHHVDKLWNAISTLFLKETESKSDGLLVLERLRVFQFLLFIVLY